MASLEGKYNIKAIATMLGIEPGTLRAWERRYRIVKPIRNQAGHRLYSDEHVAILRWLMDKVDKGFSIGQAAALYEKEQLAFQGSSDHAGEDRSAELAMEILEALLSFKENEANQLFNRAFSLFSIDKVTIDLVKMMMLQMERLLSEKQVTAARRQYAITFLRLKVGRIFQDFSIHGTLPKIVAFSGQNEELDLLIFSLFLRRKGFEVIYLGAGLSVKDVEAVLHEVDSRVVVTFCQENSSLHTLGRLKKRFTKLVIGVSGPAVSGGSGDRNEAEIIGQTKEEWELWLKRNQLQG